jgi:integration host factor subunit alpha
LNPVDPEGLTRAEIIQTLHDCLSISRRDAKDILESFIEILSRGLEEGAQITFTDLGRFQVKPTPSRPGRNPKTGQNVEVPAKNRPCFTMSRNLRTVMAERYESLGKDSPVNQITVASDVINLPEDDFPLTEKLPKGDF